MKRYFAFALAMALVCICLAPCFAFPASATSDDSSGMEESYATVAAVPMERACFENIIFSQTRSLQLNFGGLDKNNIKLGATCRVTQGSTVLKVNNCTWDSEKTITIGFFNVDGDTDYGVNFSSGYVTSTRQDLGHRCTLYFLIAVLFKLTMESNHHSVSKVKYSNYPSFRF